MQNFEEITEKFLQNSKKTLKLEYDILEKDLDFVGTKFTAVKTLELYFRY